MDAARRTLYSDPNGHMDLFDSHDQIPARSRLHSGALGLYTSPLHRFGRLWRRYATNRRALASCIAEVPAILPHIPPQPILSPPGTWVVLRAHWTITDVAVIAVGPPGGEPAAFIKIPGSADGLLNLRRQSSVLSALHADRRLGELVFYVPLTMAEGEDGRGRGWIAEGALAGCELQSLMSDSDSYMLGLDAAARFIGELHECTASRTTVDRASLARWVDAPLELLQLLASTLPRSGRYSPIVTDIRRVLHDSLSGREVVVSWIHGDFWPSNVLVSPDGVLTGIVDWERAAPDELPVHDVLHLVLHTARFDSEHSDLGTAVRALLEGASMTVHEQDLLRTSDLPLPADTDGLRVMLMLYWLRYVATYLAKVPDQARNQWWVRRNVGAILRAW